MKTKIGITCVFGLGMLVALGLGIDNVLRKDYINAIFFYALFSFIGGLLGQMWYKSPNVKREEALFKQKMKVLEYVVLQKQGTRDGFCQEHGLEMYNYCLDRGYIHEPLDCNPDKMRWEATRLALIKKSKIDEDKKKGIL